jgi:hypothetical protein
MEHLNPATTFGQILIFVVITLKMWYDWKVEERRKRWEIEETARKEALHNHTIQKIEENTQVNTQALEAANRVNEKLVVLGEQRNAMLDGALATALNRVGDTEEQKQTTRDILHKYGDKHAEASQEVAHRQG